MLRELRHDSLTTAIGVTLSLAVIALLNPAQLTAVSGSWFSLQARSASPFGGLSQNQAAIAGRQGADSVDLTGTPETFQVKPFASKSIIQSLPVGVSVEASWQGTLTPIMQATATVPHQVQAIAKTSRP